MNPYLLSVMEFGPKVVAGVFSRIPAALWDTPIAVDRFTPREVIAHLADWEPIVLERMKTAFTAPGSTVQPWDEGLMAVTNGYRKLDPLEQLQLFTQRRADTANWLRSVPVALWSQAVLHPERGRLSIEDQANHVLGHDLYHIEQLMGSWDQTEEHPL